MAPAEIPLRLASGPGRRLLATAVTGSGMVFLDGTIANVALPRIGYDLDADLTALQWVVNGYTLTLAGLIIVGGSLGDRFGRKRMFGLGVIAFAISSAIVALSPTIGTLIAARLIQGVAAALLTPGSLAMLQASFHPQDRMKAIGAWSGVLGIATAAGPVVGGWLVGFDWRIAFWINVPLAALALWLLRGAPESRASDDPGASTDQATTQHFDWPGIVLTPVALAAITWALTDWTNQLAIPVGIGGLVATAALVIAERRSDHPMIPPILFTSRAFSSINLATLFVYAAFAGSLLFLTLFLQTSAGWSPLAAGAAAVPVSLIMMALSSRFGEVTTRFGPRRPMAAGMVLVALAFVLLSLAPGDPNYWVHLLPGIVMQGLGMSMLVAPLTGTVLQAAPDSHSGIASGINNAVSRTAGLLAVALLPLMVGLSGLGYRDPGTMAAAYTGVMRWCALWMVVGAAITVLGLRRRPIASSPDPGNA